MADIGDFENKGNQHEPGESLNVLQEQLGLNEAEFLMLVQSLGLLASTMLVAATESANDPRLNIVISDPLSMEVLKARSFSLSTLTGKVRGRDI